MVAAKKRRAQRDRQNRSNENDRPSQDDEPTSPNCMEQSLSPRVTSSPPSAFDGNRDSERPSHERSSSNASRQSSSNQQTVSRNENLPPLIVHFKNLDLGMGAHGSLDEHAVSVTAPTRSKLSTVGREATIKLNMFNVTALPTKPVYQYDVVVNQGLDKRGLIKKVWGSKRVKELTGQGWIFDGSRLAWSMNRIEGQKRIEVDLDKEQGKTPGRRPDVHTVWLKMTGQVRFEVLRSYLSKECDFGNKCLEAIGFLDHLLRETPSKKYVTFKRNFFDAQERRTNLGNAVEVFKGVYSAIRPVLSANGNTPCLSMNVDVANTAFWKHLPLIAAIKELSPNIVASNLAELIRNGEKVNTPVWVQMNKLKRVRVYTKHLGPDKTFIIGEFVSKTALSHTFMEQKEDGTERSTTVAAYFQKKWNIELQQPRAPLVKMLGGGKTEILFPMEVLTICENQRYNHKLSDTQTSEMIKFAVTPPPKRWEAVEYGLRLLDWQKDAYLKNYGMQITTAPTKVKARILANPKVYFHPTSQKSPINPSTSGRWDLMGKRFHSTSSNDLHNWGICILPGRGSPSIEEVQRFCQAFVTTLLNHGLRVSNKRPIINIASKDIAPAVLEFFEAIRLSANGRPPQLMIFVLPTKDSGIYARIKKSCDCRFGVVSQMLQASHVRAAKGQYMSNVAMKVNAKLGGSTAFAGQTPDGKYKAMSVPTCIIGADVSHAAPGSENASIAAMTMSFDRLGVKYSGAVNTNGQRVEMISRRNIEKLMVPMMKQWMSEVGGGRLPERIFYFRDGVADNQFGQLIRDEVKDLRDAFAQIDPRASQIKWTVIVASKRHHVRFFPEQGADRNGNALPGTLVETGATHPFEYDFFLCSHVAIKGTARPVHYHVLLDEIKLPPADLHQFIYDHCYQYIRSTTPVSLFPAVYYAHLCSNRGVHHLVELPGARSERSRDAEPVEVKDLIDMRDDTGIKYKMWFI